MVIELIIGDIEDSVLEQLASGDFLSNGAWFASSVLAHNLLRWSARMGESTRWGPSSPQRRCERDSVQFGTTARCLRENHLERATPQAMGE